MLVLNERQASSLVCLSVAVVDLSHRRPCLGSFTDFCKLDRWIKSCRARGYLYTICEREGNAHIFLIGYRNYSRVSFMLTAVLFS